MNKRLIIIVVVGLIALGGAFIFVQGKKSAKVKELKPQALATVAQVDICRGEVNAANLAYVKGLFEKAHPAGAKALGGLFGTNLNEETYYTALFTEMVRQAKAEGRNDIAGSLRAFAAGRKWYVEDGQ